MRESKSTRKGGLILKNIHLIISRLQNNFIFFFSKGAERGLNGLACIVYLQSDHKEISTLVFLTY